jgi:phosphatidate cytidylyltransferase
MLKRRVATACVLIAVLFSVLFLMPYQAFVVADVFVFTVAAWEWSNLAGMVVMWQRIIYTFLFAVILFFLARLLMFDSTWAAPLLLLALAGWGLALSLLLHYPESAGWYRQSIMLAVGFWLLLPPALGLIILQGKSAGSSLILLLIAVVAVSDIGAYFCGRRFGKRKLAINVSPGKTWEGFWGGLGASFVFALIVGFLTHLVFSEFFLLVLVVICTAAVSVLGDLFESMVKRQRGVKDSGQLLPGHGGVLDRIDGWTAAVPFFTLCYLASGRLF